MNLKLLMQYDSRNPDKGYNVDIGGKVGPRNPEIFEKISKGLKKHYETHKHVMYGKNHTEETKKKMSESAIGKPGTNTGKKFDEEWIIGISQSLAGIDRKNLRRFSEEEEKEICRLYVEEEMSTYALEKKTGCYRSTINDVLLRNGVNIRKSSYTGHNNNRNRFSKEKELEICEDYESGKFTRASLAKKYACGKTTIRDILLRNNVDLKLKVGQDV